MPKMYFHIPDWAPLLLLQVWVQISLFYWESLFLVAAFVFTGNMLANIIYGIVDPQIREGYINDANNK